uniref:Uncharacterized protein n=1 Tax=Oryza meridionalis TaxID=40149 RepID=A0A0E0DZM5_9ORYZ
MRLAGSLPLSARRKAEYVSPIKRSPECGAGSRAAVGGEDSWMEAGRPPLMEVEDGSGGGAEYATCHALKA